MRGVIRHDGVETIVAAVQEHADQGFVVRKHVVRACVCRRRNRFKIAKSARKSDATERGLDAAPQEFSTIKVHSSGLLLDVEFRGIDDQIQRLLHAKKCLIGCGTGGLARTRIRQRAVQAVDQNIAHKRRHLPGHHHQI